MWLSFGVDMALSGLRARQSNIVQEDLVDGGRAHVYIWIQRVYLFLSGYFTCESLRRNQSAFVMSK